MKKFLFLGLLIVPFICFSQKEYKNEVLERVDYSNVFKGFSFGLLVQGQTIYPNPYYGPEVNGLYNDGAYHFIVDFYIKKILIGFQMTDEYLYLKKTDASGAIWKPRGFNKSYSSLTRAYWVSLGYNIFNDFNFKIGVGFRNGPKESLVINDRFHLSIADGYPYNNPSNIFNQSPNSLEKYSEIDFSVSINYIINFSKNIGIVPELGYSFNHGGIVSGVSLIFLNP